MKTLILTIAIAVVSCATGPMGADDDYDDDDDCSEEPVTIESICDLLCDGCDDYCVDYCEEILVGFVNDYSC